MKTYLSILILVACAAFYLTNVANATDTSCGPQSELAENCLRLKPFYGIPQKVEAPAFACPHYSLGVVLTLPAEWGCRNPVNTPSWEQPRFCLCENGYEAAEAEFEATMGLMLPGSIPLERFYQVISTLNPEQIQTSQALRDWIAAGHTIDKLNAR